MKTRPNQAIVSFAGLTRMLRLRLRTAHGRRYARKTKNAIIYDYDYDTRN